MDERRLKPIKKIFISSPSDVYQERLKAEAIVKRLDTEFSDHFRVVPVLWEREPLKATAAPQSSITNPHDTDIVVVILWSRLGTPLADKYGVISKRQVTGTEWEFEDAFASYKERNKPDLLVYRKTDAVPIIPGDKGTRNAMDALENFIDRWFIDKVNNVYKLALREFESTTEFEEMLEGHLRKLLGGQQKQSSFIFYKGNPFRGLFSFELEHAQVFFGRTKARNDLCKLLAGRVDAGCAFVLVYGASGCGKSSLVKAGLLADLKSSGRIGQVALCRHAIIRPADKPDDLLHALSSALFNPEALPELANLSFDSHSLKNQLTGNAEQVVLPIRQALEAARRNPDERLTDRAEARLILIIDQLEELFTSGLSSEKQSVFVNLLDAWSRSGLVWVIATLRSDFLDRLDQLPILSRLSSQGALYRLEFPESNEIEQIIRKPADLAGLKFEIDKDSGTDLADQLCKAVSQAPSSLPLLEFTLDQLWHERSENSDLTFAAYNAMRGLEGALGLRAEEKFAKLPAEVQAVLPRVLWGLATVGEGLDAKLTARSASFYDLSPADPARRLVEAFLDPQSRLLVSDGEDKSWRVRVSHEALLKHWERARALLEKNRNDLQVRTRLEQAAAIWKATDKASRNERLLPRGLPLLEAKGLLDRWGPELDVEIADYIETSVKAEHVKTRQDALRTKRIFAGISSLAVLAIMLAVMFYYQLQKADKEHKIALSGVTERLAAQAVLLADGALEDTMIERAAVFAIESWHLVHNHVAAYAANKLFRMLPKYRIQHDGTITSIAFSPDSRLLATGTENHMLRLIDAKSGQVVRVLPLEQGGRIFSVNFSPDGRFLATGSEDNTARLIDVGSGRVIRSLAHNGDVLKVIFSPDNRLLATASKDHRARLFDVVTGRELRQIAHGDEVRTIAFSPDGRMLATASKDRTLRLIDTATGNELINRIEHGAEVNHVVFSQDGKLLATASADTTARVIEVNSGNVIRQIKHDAVVFSVAFHPNGLWLATASDDKKAKVTEISTGHEIAQFSHLNGVFSVRFSPDGRLLATSSLDNSARLIATGNWREITRIVHGGAVWNIAFSPDSRLLATASSDKAARLIETLRYPDDINIKHNDAVFALALNPKGKFLATASKDNTAKLIDVTTGKEVKVFYHGDFVYGVSFSLDGQLLATASKDHTAKLIAVATGTEIASINHGDEVRSIAFSPDSRLLATGSLDKSVKLINTSTGLEIRQIENSGEIGLVVFDFDGKRLAIANKYGLITLINSETGQPLKKINLPASVTRIYFSPDGRFLTTASEDGVARIIEIATGKEHQFVHADAVLNVAFSPDGRLLAMSGMDNTAQLIDIGSGKQIAFIKHTGPVTSIAFNPEGTLLATGSQDGSIRLIETASGLEIERLSVDDAVWALAFGADGKLLASGGMDGRVQLHDANPETVFERLCTERAGRNLTRQEIQEYLWINAPTETCPKWRNAEAIAAAQ